MTYAKADMLVTQPFIEKTSDEMLYEINASLSILTMTDEIRCITKGSLESLNLALGDVIKKIRSEREADAKQWEKFEESIKTFDKDNWIRKADVMFFISKVRTR